MEKPIDETVQDEVYDLLKGYPSNNQLFQKTSVTSESLICSGQV